MRIKLLLVVLMLSPYFHYEDALAVQPNQLTASVEALNEEERSALNVEISAAQARWNYDVVQALLSRNEADDVAMASLLLIVHHAVEDANCGQNPGCLGGQSDAKTLELDRLALGALALERADELSYLMLRLVTAQQMKSLDEAQQDELLALMIARAPDDWLGWMTKLEMLKKRGTSEEQMTQELVLAAGSINGAREWFYAMTRDVVEAYSLVSPPDGLLEQLRLQSLNAASPTAIVMTEDNVRLVTGLGYSMAVAMPQLPTLHTLCKDNEPQVVQRHAACTNIAKALATQSRSVLERQFGLAIWHGLAEGSNEELAIIAAKRRHYWLLENSTQLQLDPESEAKAFERLVEQLKVPDSSEISYIQSLLLDADIALNPPDAWQPLNAAVMHARR